MKLATALAERHDLQRRLTELRQRLEQNARVQEGDTPAEEPAALLQQLDACTDRLQLLVGAINVTNCRPLPDGTLLSDRLARRDALRRKVNILQDFINSAADLTSRYSRSEIRVHSTVNVAEMRAQVNRLSRELRECDEDIQMLNWTIDLAE